MQTYLNTWSRYNEDYSRISEDIPILLAIMNEPEIGGPQEVFEHAIETETLDYYIINLN